MLHDPWFYAAAVPAMILLGLSKGGFASLGILAVPIMALVISPVQAAGITLPILILSDIVAVVAYWRVFDKRTVQIVLPGSIVGIGIAWLTAAWVTEHEVRLIVGAISVLFALNYWFRHRLTQEPHGHDVVKGTFWSIVAGFTSFISHSGGAPYQMYAVPLRLEPRVFAGTTVLIFAIINAIKTVPYFFLGQFDTANLTASLVLLPISIPATFLGVWLVNRIDIEAFYRIVYVLIFVVGIYLIGEGLSGIL
jgi:uncharacterized membrane protein YfcA